MSDLLSPYPDYRDSGLPWTQKIPAHWQAIRAKQLFTKESRPVFDGDGVVTCFRDGTVTLRKNRRMSGFTEALKEIGYQGVRKGDLVIHAMDAFAGAVGVSDSDGKCSPVCSVCRPADTVNPYYYAFVIREMSRSLWILALSKGIRERSTDFRFDDFGGQTVPVPPAEEQAAIVKYLDHAERRIRKYIAAKRRLIALLSEQKQAVIHRAVTRGLAPAATLRPSGIPWLGDIPAHWEVTRMKDEFHCLNTKRVPLSSTERGAMTRREYDYYGASGVIDKVEDYIFDDELLLIAEDGANLVLRNLPLAIIARGKFWVNNHAHILKPKRGNLEYLAAFLETINYRPWITGAAQPKLTQDRLLSITLCVAPRSEQDAIMAYVDQATAPLRTTIAAARREIDLLREYRTRLIADVVTGKLDVRAAALPDLPAADLTPDSPNPESDADSEDPAESDDDPVADEA